MCVLFSILIVLLGFVPVSLADTESPISAWTRFETSFSVSIHYENPFDSSQIQVDADIQGKEGASVLVPCYFDGQTWKLRYTPSLAGAYTYRITAKNVTETVDVKTGGFEVSDQSNRGFVRVGKNTSRHFVFENGESYFPLGENLGWVQGREPRLANWTSYLDECSDAGMNWIRIWMCSWGLTELTWTPYNNRYYGYKRYDMGIAEVIDGIFQEAEKRGIYIQWVINHHGQYSKETNPIWNENPFNVANGGFLNQPWEFFTNQEAKRYYRDRLRYLVARWGYSTHLLAWEFWNEVNLTSNFNFPAVKQWHEEMARYLREIDPYDHLLTTSVAGDYENIYTIEGLDYLQTHAYESDLIGKLVSTSQKRVRDYPLVPHLFGEMAYDWQGPVESDPTGISLHDQLWASVHATQDAGTAMTWWWDNWVRPQNLYPHFRALANYLQDIDWDRENLIPMQVSIEPQPENRGMLYFVPKIGWGNTKRTHFTIKETGEVLGLDECTQFVHGANHRDMAPNPVFLTNLSDPGEFGFMIQTVSANGAHCSVFVDDRMVFQRVFAPGEKDSTMDEDGKVVFTVPAGHHTVSIKNDGQDWFQVQYYFVNGLTQRPEAFARGNREKILVWIHDRMHQLMFQSVSPQTTPIVSTSLTLPDLRDGEYLVEQFDPYTGESGDSSLIPTGENGLVIPIPSFEKDLAFRIGRNLTGVETPLR